MLGYVVSLNPGSLEGPRFNSFYDGDNTIKELNDDLTTGSTVYTPGADEIILSIQPPYSNGDLLAVIIHNDGTEDASLRKITSNGGVIWTFRVNNSEWPVIYKELNADVFWFATDKSINKVDGDGNTSLVFDAIGDGTFPQMSIRDLFVNDGKLFVLFDDDNDFKFSRIDEASGSIDYTVVKNGLLGIDYLGNTGSFITSGRDFSIDYPYLERRNMSDGSVSDTFVLNDTDIEFLRGYSVITNPNNPNVIYSTHAVLEGGNVYYAAKLDSSFSIQQLFSVRDIQDFGTFSSELYNNHDALPNRYRITKNITTVDPNSEDVVLGLDLTLRSPESGLGDKTIDIVNGHYASDGTQTPLPGPVAFLGELGPSIIPNFWTGFKSAAEVIPGNRGVEE